MFLLGLAKPNSFTCIINIFIYKKVFPNRRVLNVIRLNENTFFTRLLNIFFWVNIYTYSTNQIKSEKPSFYCQIGTQEYLLLLIV